MKEITIIEEFSCKENCNKDDCEKCFKEHSKIEQVPENFTELKELVNNYSGKINSQVSGYSVGKTAITIVFDGLNLHFDKNGIFNDFVRINLTPARQWQIIKSLIGEE